MPKIIDVIHTNKQIFIVLDELPNFVYERRGKFLEAEDSGFFNFYKFDLFGNNKAFGGRRFDIPLKDGSVEKAHGQWWDSVPNDYYGLLYNVGISTLDKLANCYVFHSGKIDKKILDEWLRENAPSKDYHKYNNIRNQKHTEITK